MQSVYVYSNSDKKKGSTLRSELVCVLSISVVNGCMYLYITKDSCQNCYDLNLVVAIHVRVRTLTKKITVKTSNLFKEYLCSFKIIDLILTVKLLSKQLLQFVFVKIILELVLMPKSIVFIWDFNQSTASFFQDNSKSLGRLIGIQPRKGNGDLYLPTRIQLDERERKSVRKASSEVSRGHRPEVSEGLCIPLLVATMEKMSRSKSKTRPWILAVRGNKHHWHVSFSNFFSSVMFYI